VQHSYRQPRQQQRSRGAAPRARPLVAHRRIGAAGPPSALRPGFENAELLVGDIVALVSFSL